VKGDAVKDNTPVEEIGHITKLYQTLGTAEAIQPKSTQIYKSDWRKHKRDNIELGVEPNETIAQK
jgi:hypothetical protein